MVSRGSERGLGYAREGVKEKYRDASIVGGNRVVFNIKGNDCRLVVRISNPARIVYVRIAGAHAGL